MAKQNVWFTADTHFGHAAIIKHCKRPFATIEEMDEALLKNINDKVKPTDRLYFLGDMTGKNKPVDKYLERINCQHIFFIRGNHDPKQLPKHKLEAVGELATIEIEGQPIVLCHYALRVWNRSHYGAWNLHGHSHGQLPRIPGVKAIDVGVDVFDYQPVSFEQVRNEMHVIDELKAAMEVGGNPE